MVYKNWKSSRVSLAVSVDWYDVHELMETLQTIRRKIPSHQLAEHYELISKLRVSAPYSENERFPGDNKKYFCDIAGKMTRLHLFYYKENNAVVFSEILLDTIHDILQEYSVYDRRTFELWGDVEWFD